MMMTIAFKKTIENLANEKAPGPSTTFQPFHIFYALELMANCPIGRNKLAETLGVGDGAVRTIISRLKQESLITVSRSGCTLTNKGKSVWSQIEKTLPVREEVERNPLANSEFNYAFIVKNSSHKVKTGIEQRDAAVKAGAKRAIAIIEEGDHLSIKTVSDDVEKDYPDASPKILKQIRPRNNDILVIAGGDTPLVAMHGAFAASWTLIDN